MSLFFGIAHWVGSIFELAVSLAAWMGLGYLAMWTLVLTAAERAAIISLLPRRRART
jgi:hypothetical protein